MIVAQIVILMIACVPNIWKQLVVDQLYVVFICSSDQLYVVFICSSDQLYVVFICSSDVAILVITRAMLTFIKLSAKKYQLINNQPVVKHIQKVVDTY